MSQDEPSQLKKDLDIVAMTVSHQIGTNDQGEYIRSCIPAALKLLVIVPVLAVLTQLFRWSTGVSEGWFFSWSVWGVMTVAVPLIWVAAKAMTFEATVSRQRALMAADETLGSSERIVTADHFLDQPSRDGFMQAAVEDASDWAHRARDTSLDPSKEQPWYGYLSYWPVPAAIAILALAALLAQFALEQPANDSRTADTTTVADPISIEPESTTPKQKPPVEDIPETEQREEPPQDQRSQRMVNRQGSAGAAIPDNAEESRGKLSEGETRESQQTANPSSARGAPSTSGQPSKSGDESKRKPKPKQKRKPEEEREKKPREQEEKPSGATAGQGSSKGSDNNAAPSDWASTSQAATPDDEDIEDEEDVADEEEEQESRGGIQPNLRDRRTPVNRDLQIGFGNNRPNPDANGRGGPGGQKKSRGVASLVLGVPIPDRVNGQPNKGRIRITQQRITPEAEQSDPVAAQYRYPRQGSIGPIHHPDLSPWLQDLVRRYFLERRAQFPLQTSPQQTATSPTSQEPLQTSVVSESESPQS
ncbi:MAG: hypothetical protein AAGG48_16035 [Planctomycetota bacterium]